MGVFEISPGKIHAEPARRQRLFGGKPGLTHTERKVPVFPTPVYGLTPGSAMILADGDRRALVASSLSPNKLEESLRANGFRPIRVDFGVPYLFRWYAKLWSWKSIERDEFAVFGDWTVAARVQDDLVADWILERASAAEYALSDALENVSKLEPETEDRVERLKRSLSFLDAEHLIEHLDVDALGAESMTRTTVTASDFGRQVDAEILDPRASNLVRATE